MWNELKEKIEGEKDNAWAKGFVDDYEMFLNFSETVRDIENNEWVTTRKGE